MSSKATDILYNIF